MKKTNSIFGQNLETLVAKWEIKQQEMEGLLYLGKGVVSGYIAGKGFPRPVTLIRLEELTGISIYRWLKTIIGAYEMPAAPLESYLPGTAEPQSEYGTASVLNTPLPALLRSLSDRIDAIEQQLKNCKNCQ